jgi:putative tricarboxylic transport membrane protein
LEYEDHLMDTLLHLGAGFSAALSPMNLLMALIGAFMGTLVGVLPGLGPTSAIAILIPLTSVLQPTPAIIMMAGIFYGAMYGGSTTAILLNIPGEVASVPTCLDGYPLAQQGRGGPALGIAAIGSFIAGTLGVVGLTFFAPYLADQALKFGPPEYFGLMLLALTAMIGLSGGSMLKALMMGCAGYLLSLGGIGPSSGLPRFNYGTITLYGGVEMISLVIGIFAISEVLVGLEESRTAVALKNIGSVYPGLKDMKTSFPAIMRGTAVGFFWGLLPGLSAAVTTFMAYDLEKKVSRHPEKFGKGAIEGVAAPESANNATSQAGFIPLLALGIPASPTLAILMGGLMLYGLQPGPMLFAEHADFVWTIIASMYIGNVILLVLNLPLVGMWAKLANVPYGILGPIILIICIVGAYTVNNRLFDIFVALVFGMIGYLMRKYQWPAVPLILCFVLGPMLERSVVESLAISGGSVSIFFEHKICLGLIIAAAILLVISLKVVKRAEQLVKEAGGETIFEQ